MLSKQDLVMIKHALNQYTKYSLNIPVGRIKPSTVIELMNKIDKEINK